MHCNTLPHTATHLQHAATRCNTLQHTATHCLTPHHTCDTLAAYCSTLYIRNEVYIYQNRHYQHTAAHCNTLQPTSTHCKTLAAQCSTPYTQKEACMLQCVAVCCSVLQCVYVRNETYQRTAAKWQHTCSTLCIQKEGCIYGKRHPRTHTHMHTHYQSHTRNETSHSYVWKATCVFEKRLTATHCHTLEPITQCVAV